MKITPLDIYQKEFRRKALNGLDPQDVEDFLFQIAEAVETLIHENADLKRRLQRASAGQQDVPDETALSHEPSRTAAVEELKRARAEARRVKEEAREEAQARISEARAEAERLRTVGRTTAQPSEATRNLATESRQLAEAYQTLLVRHLSSVTQLLSDADHPDDASEIESNDPELETESTKLGTERV